LKSLKRGRAARRPRAPDVCSSLKPSARAQRQTYVAASGFARGPAPRTPQIRTNHGFGLIRNASDSLHVDLRATRERILGAIADLLEHGDTEELTVPAVAEESAIRPPIAQIYAKLPAHDVGGPRPSTPRSSASILRRTAQPPLLRGAWGALHHLPERRKPIRYTRPARFDHRARGGRSGPPEGPGRGVRELPTATRRHDACRHHLDALDPAVGQGIVDPPVAGGLSSSRLAEHAGGCNRCDRTDPHRRSLSLLAQLRSPYGPPSGPG